MSVRWVLAGIASVYVMAIMSNVFDTEFTGWNGYGGPLSTALLILVLIGLVLHIAVVVISRSWKNAFIAFGSMYVLFMIILRALMKVTGDSL